MKLVIGLGNPGEEYDKTRHNAGYLLIDELKEGTLPNETIAKKTDCYMNNSGDFVSKTANYYKVSTDNIFILHDDLDILFGQYKIQQGIGPKDHNGILDIEEKLKSDNFWRIRIGTDNRDPNIRIPGEVYVLQKFNKEELELLNNDVFPRIVEELRKILQ